MEQAAAAEDMTLLALTPTDMAGAQQDLLAWCDRKIDATRSELADMEANLELATEHGWKHASVQSALNRTTRRIAYFEKIKAAVQAGYLIVPNFPIDIFAVRVKREKQPARTHDSDWGGFRASAEMLPAGEGRYVDDSVKYLDQSHTEVVDGKDKRIRRYVTDEYDAVDFPVAVVKPAVMQATARAMALRIFDEMGTVTNTAGRDPIVVGRLLDPRGNRRCVTFFVAWWLDTADL